MKIKILFGLSAMAALMNLSNAQNLKTTADSVSYSLSILIAQNLQQQGFDSIDLAIFTKGFTEAMKKKPLLLDAAKANAVIQDYINQQKTSANATNILEGKKFLADNAARKEVVTTASGLQYEILTKGTGPIPTTKDKVRVHYHGTLINGKVFDSSVLRGEPISFAVTGVIQGWVEALQLMPVGSKWKLFIPYNLAYGEQGSGSVIGPYSTLIFEVELLGIE
jgi:FKBP-type peptidyl-prolyl cis-trans isomerase FklB